MAEYNVNKYTFGENTYLLEDNRISDNDAAKLIGVSANAASILLNNWDGNGEQNLSSLVINKLTKAQYDTISSPSNTQLYFITDDTIYATKDYVDTEIANIDALPAQSGNSGKFLTTNGSIASWANVDALPSQSGHSGKFLSTNGTTASWATVDALPSQSGNSGKYLTTDGTAASWAALDLSTSVKVFNRSDIGTSPNFDNPGVNGLFEVRNSSETTGETGTKPFNGFGPMLNLKTSDNIAMLQLAGTNGTGFFIRGKQAANVTLASVDWQRLVTNSGTWAISISGNAATATTASSCSGNAATATTASSCSGNSATATSATSASSATNATNATNIYSSASTSKAYVLGTTTASSANHATVYAAQVYTQSNVLYGAAWNDYAEYRQAETTEPGRCVKESPTGIMELTTKRMEKGCEIISDTFGFAIGEDEKCKTPIAATGRVLAYTDRPREEFELGMPVCSGPNGTVSQMTEEEARQYPWCIIGTVSEIPTYEEWGAGNVKVNNRIWIRIR